MKKKILSLAAAFAACIGIQSAHAHLDWEGFYVGASGSVDWHRDIKQHGPIPAPSGTTVDIDHNTGGNAALFVGYQWNEWRAELEGAFRHNSIDTIKVSVLGASGSTSVGDHSRIWSIMANGYYDFPLENCFSLYVGAGVGVGFHRLEVDAFTTTVSGPVAKVNTKDTTFAWQLMTGVGYEISDQVSLFAGYRFFAITKPSDFTYVGGVPVKVSWNDFPYVHSVEAGLRIRL